MEDIGYLTLAERKRKRKRRKEKIIGEGAFGSVHIEAGKAVKVYHDAPSLIREYAAGMNLKGCKNVVQVDSVSLPHLSMTMSLHETDLRQWLKSDRTMADKKRVLRDILLGLVEIHDRGLVHGDIKPNNILIDENPLKATIGDIGFTNICSYVTSELTAPGYKDPSERRDYYHDIFSLGMLLMSLFFEYRTREGFRLTYRSVDGLCDNLMREHRENPKIIPWISIIRLCTQEDRSRRPNSRELLLSIFKQSPKKPPKRTIKIVDITRKTKEKILLEMGELQDIFKLKRVEKGIQALISHLGHIMETVPLIGDNEILEYCYAMIYILCSLFSRRRKINRIIKSFYSKYGDTPEKEISLFDKIIEMIHNKNVLSILYRKWEDE